MLNLVKRTIEEDNKVKFKSANLIWGILLLLAAAFVLLNQFGYFAGIKVINIIIAALAIAIFVQCLVHLHFAPLPIPLAIMYIVLQNPLNLPYIQAWALITASILVTIGLSLLFPRKKHHKHYRCTEDRNQKKQAGSESNDNNPSVSIIFGTLGRHLHADSLETAQLRANFGELEVFFDQVELNPKGAEVFINCNFGAIKLFVPKHWRIIDRLNCTLGAVELDVRFATPTENSPQLTLIGSVSLGEINIRYI
jgi:predicted membrane protein